MELLTSVFKSNVRCAHCAQTFKKLQKRRQCKTCKFLYCENCSIKVKISIFKTERFCSLCFERQKNLEAIHTPTEEEYQLKLSSSIDLIPSNPLSKYLILQKLFHSHSGEVFLAEHTQNNKKYAIKSRYPTNKTEKTKIYNEIYMLNSTQHPNIVEIKEVYQHLDIIWVVTTYWPKNLASLLPLPCEEGIFAYILLEVIKALAWLHRYSKVHRAIAPENILINKKGEIALADFGKAVELTTDHPRRRSQYGLHTFVAPEENVGVFNNKTDIWNLGLLGLELAENEGLFGNYWKDELPEVEKRWSRELKSFVGECLNVNESLRPTAEELMEHPFLKRKVSKQEFARISFSFW